ncbi:MAG: hypothetical protein K1X82_01035 [Bacteroidia bacterium]|nr:hypothetical protein [Bacteroidia bacterium]
MKRVGTFLRKVKLFLVFIILYLGSNTGFAQTNRLDSLENLISKKLCSHGFYEAFYGFPKKDSANNLLSSAKELDRRLLFYSDHTFEEIEFKDWDSFQFPESCYKTKKFKSFVALLSGEWKLMGETILLKYKYELVYKEADFRSCFGSGEAKRFKCVYAPLCNFELNIKRMFLFKKNELQEIGHLEYGYE